MKPKLIMIIKTPNSPMLQPPLFASCASDWATITGVYVLPAVKSAEIDTRRSESAGVNEALRSSESERRSRDESSGCSRSSDAVKVYVPEVVGVKAGRTARTS